MSTTNWDKSNSKLKYALYKKHLEDTQDPISLFSNILQNAQELPNRVKHIGRVTARYKQAINEFNLYCALVGCEPTQENRTKLASSAFRHLFTVKQLKEYPRLAEEFQQDYLEKFRDDKEVQPEAILELLKKLKYHTFLYEKPKQPQPPKANFMDCLVSIPLKLGTPDTPIAGKETRKKRIAFCRRCQATHVWGQHTRVFDEPKVESKPKRFQTHPPHHV